MNQSRSQVFFIPAFVILIALSLLPVLAFAAFSYKVTVNKIGTGGGRVFSIPSGINCGTKCSSTFPSGMGFSLYASADAQSDFIGWQGCLPSSTANRCPINVDGNKQITAEFALKAPPVSLTVSITGTGQGKVTSSPAGINCAPTCTYAFLKGQKITLTPVPDANSNFTSWSGDCTGANCTVDMNTAKSVSANFDAKSLKGLTVTKNGTGTGRIVSTPAGIDCGASCSASFGEGNSVTLTATPDANVIFDGWSGCNTSTTTTCTVTMNAAKSVTATFTRITGAVSKLNDTGITACADATTNSRICPLSTFPGQDGDFGRDKTNNNDSDGHAGFSFTKISNTGAQLSANAASWSCVQDNVTGLMWEVKTNDNGLHDKDWTYSWYQPDNTKNGGNAGVQNKGSCGGTSQCDTDAYVTAVNTAGWCGHNDWRMPDVNELLNIASLDRSIPTMDTDYFPNTDPVWFWSSSPYASSSSDAWNVLFYDATDELNSKGVQNSVWLVRSGP